MSEPFRYRSFWQYLRAMAAVAWACLRYPAGSTVDLETGEITPHK